MNVNIITIIPKGNDPIRYLTFNDPGQDEFVMLCNEHGYEVPEWDEETCWYKSTAEFETYIEYVDGDQYI